ncbi:hypothetical protein BB561_006601 [Smittium simulii]|uniref:Uncharacterized protein n=1 Tax=Smittium simulii TaxID=133385 RepID=A0A2T9Y315_9FUNG|nr:hypothetical protein BB561_006601 [Smittium simulii]
MSTTKCKTIQIFFDSSTQILTKCRKLKEIVSLRQEINMTDRNIQMVQQDLVTIASQTIEHMLLKCSRWQALRADILAQYINKYKIQVASKPSKPSLFPASISMRLVGKLLGKELKLSSTRIRKDPTVLCTKSKPTTISSGQKDLCESEDS